MPETTQNNHSSAKDETACVLRLQSENTTVMCEEARGNDLLSLNVGGKEIVQTLRSTLTFAQESVLAASF
jgi:hypothetical protein